MGKYTPPFQQNTTVINLLAVICELVGRVEVTHRDIISVQLRRQYQIRAIHSSLQMNKILSLWSKLRLSRMVSES